MDIVCNTMPKVLALKPGVCHNIIIHASPTARNFSLSNFNLLGSFDFVISTPLSSLFLALIVTNAYFFVGLRIKTGRPAFRRKRLMKVPVFGSHFGIREY